MLNRIVPLLAIALLSHSAQAANTVTFSNATINAASPTMAAGYFTAVSSADDAITGVASDCCDAVELHKNEVINNVMRMRKIDALELKASAPTTAQPSHGISLAAPIPGVSLRVSEGIPLQESVHVMLIGPKKPLQKGDVVPVTFSFKRAPKQVVNFTVDRGQPGEHAHH